ncbi:hypothetical protein [Desulfofustis glycolicus]|uniref:Uncharacterized protein n=1 Tax=Desulfofustis glycolicus DSM 9705 TaxID=1121409 RepID=A0A1M5YTJ9_9BACT|nr:hypothetical protein [Desulfofustis glycolicus]MCB2218558.1 hypothetical protein [Desulfobulbaceae bacterium]SHI15447.1 hypothetical protein SAMN02745124_04437 [Desulfofustis glycolicus DSM 9705]
MKRTQFILTAICAACLLLTSLSSVAQSESRFTQGFRGIVWGTHKDQLPDLGLSKKALKNIYESGPASVLFMEGKGNLDLHFDTVPLLSVFMHFNDQHFTAVDMLFKPEDREEVISIVTSETGAATSENDGEKQWQTKEISITITDRELMVTTPKE